MLENRTVTHHMLKNIVIFIIIILNLTGVAQWTECQPANQRVTSSIPSQGTCLGCRLPHWGACERQSHIDVSLSPSLPLSKNK